MSVESQVVSYGNLYGMQKTTVYLPEDLKLDLQRVAHTAGCSEADLIREGVRRVVDAYHSPPPRIPLFKSDDPTLAEHVDKHLAGFGER